MHTPSFRGLRAASARAATAARATSRKRDTKCELLLRNELWRRGLRYGLHKPSLPGKPDIIFARRRVAIFCDGDFWHGRDLAMRVRKLALGHNSNYWVAKVERNVERDQQHNVALKSLGWTVLRFWESDILRNVHAVADQVSTVVKHNRPMRSQPNALQIVQ
jgi:DNA mismatch endonuclease, patch repair protein